VDDLTEVRRSPTGDGRVVLVVARPSVDEREVLTEATLDLDEGLVGDNWARRPSRSTAGGGPDPDKQLNVMNARAAALIAGDPDRWPLAGDQLFVDLDLSETALPVGSRLQVGSAVIEVTAPPHLGCAKFSARFGPDALRLVNSPAGRELRLRGLNARVVTPGTVRPGDSIVTLPADR
jgi:MOSC domain-containing protein YiiM